MAQILSDNDRLPVPDMRGLPQVRQKFREVFGYDPIMNDEALARHYRVSGDGDLIMILR